MKLRLKDPFHRHGTSSDLGAQMVLRQGFPLATAKDHLAMRWRGLVGIALAATLGAVQLVAATTGAASSWAGNTAGSLSPADGMPGAKTTRAIVAQEDARNAYVRLPLSFERNVGQTDPQVDFLARGSGYALFLTPTEAVLSLRGGTAGSGPATDPPDVGPRAVVRMHLVGANRQAAAEGRDAFPARVNYFVGSDPAAWRTDVPTYARVQYQDVYPGIDMAYYGAQQQLEYDFLVAPGADPAAIALSFDGADVLEIDGNGDLLLHTPGGTVLQRKPVIYQEVDGARQTVAGGYALTGERQVGFALGAYDAARPLVIDPVVVYSTWLASAALDWATGIAVDGSGNVYVTGYTDAADFPTTPVTAYDASYNGNRDAFVAGFDATLSTLLYSSYFGGSGDDSAHGIAINANGLYVVGATNSLDLPTTVGAYQTYNAGNADVFVMQLNPALSGTGALVYSSYLGGAGGDYGRAIAVDTSGVYVAGFTLSDDFPTTSTAYATTLGSFRDGFVTMLNAPLSQVVYSTYLGSAYSEKTMDEAAAGIAVKGNGLIYVTGTVRGEFPTTPPEAYDATFDGVMNAFVAVLDPGLSGAASLVYGTYLGGSGPEGDQGHGIAVDGSGNVYVTGTTFSSDFPTTAGAYDTTNGGRDAFAAKLNPALSGAASLLYSTYLGGWEFELGQGIAADDCGNVYVTGLSQGWQSFPTTADAYYAPGTPGWGAFVAKLNMALTGAPSLVYSTFIGQFHETGMAIAVDASGSVYAAGFGSPAEYYDAFAVKLELNSCLGAITIVKDAQPNDAQDFTFLFGNGATGGAFTLDDDAGADGADDVHSNQQVLTGLAPGPWTIEEFQDEPLPGWALASIVCDPSAGTTVGPAVGSGTVVVDVAPGSEVTCTFTNAKLGSITIAKNAEPNDLQDFSFNATGGNASFSLDDDAGVPGADNVLSNQKAFSLLPGEYTFAEGLAVTGANLVQNGSFETGPAAPIGAVVLPTGSTSITGWAVSSGTIAYVDGFWVTTDGTHAVHLNGTSPGAISQTFATVSGQQYLLSFDLAGSPAPYPAIKTVEVTAGSATQTYTFDVTGKDPSHMGWQHKEFAFTASGPTTTLAFTSLTANMTLPGAGEVSVGPAIDNVAVRAVAAWSLAGITCSPSADATVDVANRSVTVAVTSGAYITCTFFNGQEPEVVTPVGGTIVIVKQTLPPSGHAFTFHLNPVVGSGPGGTWPLTDNTSDTGITGANSVSHGVAPGIYLITEDATTGWAQTSATCDNGDPVTAIQVTSGATVTCTFTNTEAPAPPPTPTPTPQAVPGATARGLVLLAGVFLVALAVIWRRRLGAIDQGEKEDS